MDIGADVSITSLELWHPSWPLQEVNAQFGGIGLLSQVRQSEIRLECIELEGQKGILKHVANIAINLWGPDFLQQWNTQINIPSNTEVSHRLAHGSGRNIKRYYEKQSQTIQVIEKQGKS